MKQGTFEDFAQVINRMNEYKEAHYSVSKMKELLGDEPWNPEDVLFLYMKNFDGMRTLLSEHKGYIAFSHMRKLKYLLSKMQKCHNQIITDVENYEKDYFSRQDVCNDILDKTQDSVNLFFYAYISLSYSIIELESRIQKNFISNKENVSKAFENTLLSDAHSCIMFIRNKMNHGLALEFHWQTHIDYINQIRAVKFGLRKDNLQALATHINGEKDRNSYKFLESKNAGMLPILNEHFPKMQSFVNAVCNIIYEENEAEIKLCNLYYSTILLQMDTQARAIVKQIKGEATAPQSTDSELWALERAVV